MEDMLMIACVAAGDMAAWACPICETANWAATRCVCCDRPKAGWSEAEIEEMCPSRDYSDMPIVQVPLPYMHIWDVPANYAQMMDLEREGALQLEMRLFW